MMQVSRSHVEPLTSCTGNGRPTARNRVDLVDQWAPVVTTFIASLLPFDH
jgi:hypothetical protein